MSQPKKGAKPDVPSQKSGVSLPGVLSALTVVAILALLGIMLANRTGSEAQVSETANLAPTTIESPADATDPFASDTHATEGESTTENEVTPPAPAAGEEGMYSSPPPMTIDPEKDYTATITTPRGDIVVRLRPDIAPQSVNNFVFLAREGFYDGLTWHRVLENFMAQGGDPTGTGMGGPGYSIPAEFTNEVLFDRPGLLAMARSSDPNSAGSQFFITTAAAPWLNGQYTIFGEVVEGQDIVTNIPLRDPDTATTPGEEIVSVTIEES